MKKNRQLGISVPFRAPIREWLLEGDLRSYGTKLLSIGPSLIVIGLLVARLTGTYKGFLRGYPYYVGSIVMSTALFVIVYGCKGIDNKIRNLDKVVKHTKHEKYSDFISKVYEEKWFGLPLKHCYYIHFIVFVLIFAFGLGYLCVKLNMLGALWLKDGQGNIIIPNLIYNIFWYAVGGYVIRLAFELVLQYALLVKRYCEFFVTDDNVRILPVQEAGGLKPLGELALTINIGCLIPVAYAFASIYSAGQSGTLSSRWPFYILFLSTYVVGLAVFFFYPLRPTHKALKEAKKKAIKHVDSQLKRKYGRGIFKNPKDYENFNTLTTARRNFERIPTWPLDLRLSISTAATILLPIVGGAILQIWFEFLIKISM